MTHFRLASAGQANDERKAKSQFPQGSARRTRGGLGFGLRVFFGFLHSDFFRISAFGFRISDLGFLVSQPLASIALAFLHGPISNDLVSSRRSHRVEVIG